MRLTLRSHMLPRFVRLMSSRTNGGMLSALTSRVGNLALRQNVSYRVALEGTNRTLLRNLTDLGELYRLSQNRKPLLEQDQKIRLVERHPESARVGCIL